VAASVVGLLGLVAGCSGGGDDDAGAPPRKTSTSTTATTEPAEPVEEVPFEVIGVDTVVATGGNREGVKLPKDTQSAIVGTIERYVQRATTDPLLRGGKAAALDDLFSDASRAAALGPDRAKLVDEGLPAVALRASSRGKLRLVALVAPDGSITLASARINLKVYGDTIDGRRVDVLRVGELALVDQGGAWRIESYAMNVDRRVHAPGEAT
jgi:hypothetical protein